MLLFYKAISLPRRIFAICDMLLVYTPIAIYGLYPIRLSGPLFTKTAPSYVYKNPIINLRRSDDRLRFVTIIPITISMMTSSKWKHFPRCWPFLRGIQRSLVNSPHKGQWGGAVMFSLICAWINGWVNNREAGDLRRHRAHYDVTVILTNRGPGPREFLSYIKE